MTLKLFNSRQQEKVSSRKGTSSTLLNPEFCWDELDNKSIGLSLGIFPKTTAVQRALRQRETACVLKDSDYFIM